MLPGLIQYLLCLAACSADRRADPPRPSIRVEVHADAELDKMPRHLTLARGCRDFGATAARMSTQDCPRIERDFWGDSTSIDRVEPGVYLVGLKIGRERRVDFVSLGSGDQTETIEFRRPRVHGRVTRQGSGVAATMEFSISPEPITDDSFASDPTAVDSESCGDYEARLWAGGRYFVRVTPKDGNGVSATFQFLAPTSDDSRDFVLSAHPLHVRVSDADSGQPIEGAKLVFVDPAGVQAPRSDAAGVIDLPSIAAGTFHATLVAKDYVNRIVDVLMEDREDMPPLEIAMKPRTSENGFQVYLPEGAPAGDAWAYFRFDPAMGTRVRIPCDADGICDPGERPGDTEWILLDHPLAGLTPRRAGEIYATRSVVLAPAGGPLLIRLKSGGAAPHACHAAIVSISGVPVESPGSFTCGGGWPIEVGGLPAGQVEVTIVNRRIDDQGRRIDTPVAGPVTVQMPSGPIEIPIP